MRWGDEGQGMDDEVMRALGKVRGAVCFGLGMAWRSRRVSGFWELELRLGKVLVG